MEKLSDCSAEIPEETQVDESNVLFEPDLYKKCFHAQDIGNKKWKWMGGNEQTTNK